MAKRFLPLFWLPLLLAGCATHFNNLTPETLRRNGENLYPVEVAFNTRQESVRWDTIQAYVAVGVETYPMQRVQLMRNRWETLVPVPPGTNLLHYRFKFDYVCGSPAGRRPDSSSSAPYTLKIRD